MVGWRRFSCAGFLVEERWTWVVCEKVLQVGDFFVGHLVEVGVFRIEAACEAIEVFDHAFLPTCESVGEVDSGAGDFFEFLLIDEFGAVVGHEIVDSDAAGMDFFDDAAQCLMDGCPAQVLQSSYEGALRGRENHGEETSSAVARGMDGVHLHIKWVSAGPYFLRKIVDSMGRGVIPGVPDRRFLLFPFVWDVTFPPIDARVVFASFGVILECAQAREVNVLVFFFGATSNLVEKQGLRYTSERRFCHG